MKKYNALILTVLITIFITTGCKKEKKAEIDLPIVVELDGFIGSSFNSVEEKFIKRGLSLIESKSGYSEYLKVENNDSSYYFINYDADNNNITSAYYFIYTGGKRGNLVKKILEMGDECESFAGVKNYKEGYVRSGTDFEIYVSTHRQFTDSLLRYTNTIDNCYEYWIKDSKEYCPEYDNVRFKVGVRFIGK